MVNGDDRGQLLLLAALIVAATILGSIALLNSIHESPEIATQQDSRSLQETEWVTDQTGTNLERLFRYVTSVEDADIPLPYANKSAFEDAVEDYDEQFLNLSTVSSAGLVNVSYNDSASRTGGIAHGNINYASSAPGNPDWVLFQADAVPRLRLNVTQGISGSQKDYLSVKFNQSRTGPTAELNITGDTGDSSTAVVKFVDTGGTQLWTCEIDGNTNTLTVDIRAGSAVVQADMDKFCERAPVTIPDSAWIRIVDGASTTPKGNFTITGVSSSGSDLTENTNEPAWYREEINGNDILVDPVFDIVYESPEVSYEGEYALYGGDG